MVKMSNRTFEILRSRIGEEMLGNLIEAEVLYYVFKDVIGVEDVMLYELGIDEGNISGKKIGKKNATELALVLSGGGGKRVDASSLSKMLYVYNKCYALTPKGVGRFMSSHMMKSSRVEMIVVNHRRTWEMNGFSTEEPPYIAGYERGN